jgi:predicted TIM-barrel fold metal-dependent hydrolase
MGELIPYNLQRINKTLTLGNWLTAAQLKATGNGSPKGMQKSVFYYMRKNVFITTAGVFEHAALNCAVAGLGIDNILFSVDDPFGDNFEAVAFLNTAKLSPVDKRKLASRNAEQLLELSAGINSPKRSNKSFFTGLRSSLYTYKASVKSRLGRMILSFLVK